MLRNLLGRANSNNPFAGQRAELLLQKMLKLYEAGHVDVKPDTISFSSAIAAWTKSGNALAAARTEAILRRMIEFSRQGHNDVKPDTITYASVIDAWAKSGDPLAGKKAESLLLEMLEQYNMGNRVCHLEGAEQNQEDSASVCKVACRNFHYPILLKKIKYLVLYCTAYWTAPAGL